MGMLEQEILSAEKNENSKEVVIYVTLEYCADDLFSGNGVCARSQVRGLSARGVLLHVIAGRPRGAARPRDVDTPAGVILHPCPLDIWRTTDRKSDFVSFAKQAAHVLSHLITTLSRLDALMLVDWTGAGAVEFIDSSLRASLFARAPIMYLNFRVYSRMTNISENDRQFYYQAERVSVGYAIESGGGIMSLCTEDENALRKMSEHTGMIEKHSKHDPFRVIRPMLRDEFADIAFRNKDILLDPSRNRTYFVCLVRLSKDKGPQRFVDVCAAITQKDPDFWSRTRIVPLLAGAVSQPEFGNALKRRFKQTVPSAVIIDKFLHSVQLAQILQSSSLNLHPALYEAFGMTIVEAGSCGVPSVVHYKDIGASHLLRPQRQESIATDMDNIAEVADLCMHLLERPLLLAQYGLKAYLAATSWTEAEHVNELWKLVSDRRKHREQQAPLVVSDASQ